MEILREQADPERFFRSLRGAARSLLMLDYDGTLAPFRVERDRAFPWPGIAERLDTLLHLPRTRVVIVSGRAVDELVPLIGLDEPPEIWGAHGWERLRPGGEIERPGENEVHRLPLIAAGEWIDEKGLGGRCERKAASVTLHVRGLPDEEGERILLTASTAWERIAVEGSGVEIHRFDGGIEMRDPGRDKGTTVGALIAEEPPGTPAAFLGDDRTDEDAFHALEGKGLRVLVRAEARETEADVRIEPPGGLFRFLDRWIDAMRGGAD